MQIVVADPSANPIELFRCAERSPQSHGPRPRPQRRRVPSRPPAGGFAASNVTVRTPQAAGVRLDVERPQRHIPIPRDRRVTLSGMAVPITSHPLLRAAAGVTLWAWGARNVTFATPRGGDVVG